MKHLLILVLLTAPVLICCKKQVAAPLAAESMAASLENASITSTGKLVFTDEQAEGGLAKIYQRKDGVYVLGLEQMNYSSGINDSNVYLSAGPGLSAGSIKIFSAKKFLGNLYYTLTAISKISQFKYLVIQSDTDSQPAATAQLQ